MKDLLKNLDVHECINKASERRKMSVQEYKNWCESSGMILPGNLTKLPNVLSSTRIALTWGDCGEMQQTGTGVTMDDLRQIQADYDGIAELIEFTVPEECPHTLEAEVKMNKSL